MRRVPSRQAHPSVAATHGRAAMAAEKFSVALLYSGRWFGAGGHHLADNHIQWLIRHASSGTPSGKQLVSTARVLPPPLLLPPPPGWPRRPDPLPWPPRSARARRMKGAPSPNHAHAPFARACAMACALAAENVHLRSGWEPAPPRTSQLPHTAVHARKRGVASGS